MTRVTRWSTAAFLMALSWAVATPLGAQWLQGSAIGISGGTAEVILDEGGAPSTLLDGFGYGLAARVVIGRLELSGRYLEGELRNGSGGGEAGWVEGAAAVGVRLHPWISAEAGPRIRALTTSAGTRRLVSWQVGPRIRVPILRESVWAYGGVSGTVQGTSNARGPVERGGLGEIGLLLEPPDRPVWASLDLRVDRDRLDEGARSEYGAQVIVSVGLRLR